MTENKKCLFQDIHMITYGNQHSADSMEGDYELVEPLLLIVLMMVGGLGLLNDRGAICYPCT